MNALKIVLLCVFAGCAYGVVHDQITVRVCLEYFTVAHPPLIATNSPTLLALCWGIVATVGVGAVLGGALAMAAQGGGGAPYPAARLAWPVTKLLGIMSLTALAAGIAGYLLSARGVISPPGDWKMEIPAALHHRFMAAWFAHIASYAMGTIGGIFLCHRVWRERGRPRGIQIFPRTRGDWMRAGVIVVLAVGALWYRFGSR